MIGSSFYVNDEKQICKGRRENEANATVLSSFTAKIVAEVRFNNGETTDTFFDIEGETADRKLERIRIPAEKFAGMGWIASAWGVAAFIVPGQGSKDDVRSAIQQMSTKADIITIYRCTGWTVIDDKNCFLHCDGAIVDGRNDDKIKVELPPELSRYSLPCPFATDPKGTIDAIEKSLSLVLLSKPESVAPAIIAAFRCAIGPTDFGIHITGKSGSYKSEFASLVQSHFGVEMDARRLPGSWSSTANALEAQSYMAKNVVFVIDDYVPLGTSWQIRQLEKTADQVIRGQGNQQGRARLTDISSMQTTMYPRGVIISTGEETMTGQSLRARLMICEISKGDIEPARLTRWQKHRSKYPVAMSAWIAFLQTNLESFRERIKSASDEYRNEFAELGHARTPSMVGDLLATLDLISEFCDQYGVDFGGDRDIVFERLRNGVIGAAQLQAQYIVESDLAQVFVSTLSTMLSSGKGHLKTVHGQTPDFCELLGWVPDRSQSGFDYRAVGERLGWVDIRGGVIYLDAETSYAPIRKWSSGVLTLTRTTMWKRLKESNMLDRVDDNRQRNTVRVKCEKVTRNVVALKLDEVLEIDDDEDKDDDRIPF